MSVPPEIERHLRDLEERLLDLARCPPDEVAAILDDSFIEFGKSGRIYDKRTLLTLHQGGSRAAGPATSRALADFKGSLLAPGVILLTYRATEHSPANRTVTESLRSSVWVLRETRWQLMFHQGTPLTSE